MKSHYFFSDYPVYVCNSNTLENRKMNQPRLALEYDPCRKLMQMISLILVGVYMISGRLSSRREFTPVPSYGSVFVYIIPTQNVMPARVIPARVHPGSCA